MTHLILSYSCEVVVTRSSPTYTSQKGRQPFLCLLKSGTGVMTMERSIMGLLCGIIGSSAIMSHMYSIYLQSIDPSSIDCHHYRQVFKRYLQSINKNIYTANQLIISHTHILTLYTYNQQSSYTCTSMHNHDRLIPDEVETKTQSSCSM